MELVILTAGLAGVVFLAKFGMMYLRNIKAETGYNPTGFLNSLMIIGIFAFPVGGMLLVESTGSELGMLVGLGAVACLIGLIMRNLVLKNPVRKIFIPSDILKDYLYKCNDAGTMFALIKEDKFGGYPLVFANAKKLKLEGTRKYECLGGTFVDTKSVPGFSYCEYAPSLKDFLEQVKDMKVGREIPLTYLPLVLGKMSSDAPEDLKELILKEKEFYENRENSSYRQASCYVNTMFLNVDELE